MALLIIFLLVAFASLLASPTLYASSIPDGGFKAVLKHVDYAKRLTSNEHFQHALQRSMMRLESHKPKKQNGFTSGRVSPANGEFFMNIAIGTPPTTYLALIDTDTDFIWAACVPTQCVDGKECSKLQPPRYDPKKSSTYTKLNCNSPKCRVATNTSCNTKDNICTYKYQYSGVHPSFTQGDLAIETFRSSSFNGKDSVANFTFGCAHTLSSEFGDLGLGFVGLGRGNTSLVSQINVTVFSLCLPSYDKVNKTGMVAFGERAQIKSKRAVFADMLQNPKTRPLSYYISLKGIKVNGKSLDLGTSPFKIEESGRGGVVLDTGMTVTYLEEGAYNKLKDNLTSLIKFDKVNRTADLGLDFCFKMTKQINTRNVGKYFPTIAFTFGYEGSQTDLVLPVGNAFRWYSVDQSNEVTCLAMAAAPACDGRSSLGNMQLQDTLVVYDLAANKVSFTPNTACDKRM